MRISNDKFWRWITLMNLNPIFGDDGFESNSAEDEPATIKSREGAKKKDIPIVSDMLSRSGKGGLESAHYVDFDDGYVEGDFGFMEGLDSYFVEIFMAESIAMFLLCFGAGIAF